MIDDEYLIPVNEAGDKLSSQLKKEYMAPALIVLDSYNIEGGVSSIVENSGGVLSAAS